MFSKFVLDWIVGNLNSTSVVTAENSRMSRVIILQHHCKGESPFSVVRAIKLSPFSVVRAIKLDIQDRMSKREGCKRCRRPYGSNPEEVGGGDLQYETGSALTSDSKQRGARTAWRREATTRSRGRTLTGGAKQGGRGTCRDLTCDTKQRPQRAAKMGWEGRAARNLVKLAGGAETR
jgi:hypothetical protein